jgi:dipeptidyl-peptidase-4
MGVPKDSSIPAFRLSRLALPLALVLVPLAGTAQPAPSDRSMPTDPAQSALTIDRLYSLPNLIGTAPTGFSWSPDGTQLAFLWNEEGYPFRDVYVVDVDDPDAVPVRITTMPQRAVPPELTDAAVVAQAEAALERDRGVESVIWRPDGAGLVASFRGDLWGVAPGLRPHPITETVARESQPAFTPDGTRLTFLREGDVWTLPTDGSALTPTRITRIGGSKVGVASFRWSRDGSRLAVLERDASDVPVRGIPNYLSDETRLVQVTRPYPGEAPARQRIGIIDGQATRVGRRDIAWVQLSPGAEGGDPQLLLSYAWSPTEDFLAIDTSDLVAKNRRIFVTAVRNMPEGERLATNANLVVHEAMPENETFYFWRIAWAAGGDRLYFLSDREDDYHVWALAPGDDAPRRLTSGDWAVAAMHAVEGGLIVVGNRGNAEERQIFRVNDDGGEPVRLSGRPGTYAPTVSPDGRYAAASFSSDSVPPDLWLVPLTAPGQDDGRERRITNSPLGEFDEYRWVTPEYVTFTSHVDGTTLHGRLTLPPDFDPSRTYPAILGSVYTDAVRNQWGGRTAHPTWGLDQYLAQEGYILLNVDMRGSWGRGREHRRGIRLDYGGMDIEDLESGVHFLETLGYVDMDRVGIWGSSYGGLMTAMSLFRKPGLYAAGIAGAPATNVWHALTGQMAVMLAPQDSPDEYADSSPFLHAEGLEDPLMIIHGMRDNIVLFKDSLILVQRLLLLGKDVDLVTLPDAGHGWDNEYLAQTRFAFHKMLDFFDRHLKGIDP